MANWVRTTASESLFENELVPLVLLQNRHRFLSDRDARKDLCLDCRANLRHWKTASLRLLLELYPPVVMKSKNRHGFAYDLVACDQFLPQLHHMLPPDALIPIRCIQSKARLKNNQLLQLSVTAQLGMIAGTVSTKHRILASIVYDEQLKECDVLRFGPGDMHEALGLEKS